MIEHRDDPEDYRLADKERVRKAMADIAAETNPASPVQGEPRDPSGSFWLKHDEDLRYVSRVISAGPQMTEGDQIAAKAIIHKLRTLIRSEHLSQGEPHAGSAEPPVDLTERDPTAIRRAADGERA